MKKECFVIKNVIKISLFLLIKLNIAFKNKCSINFRENVNHINSAILKITISTVKICVNVCIKSSGHFYQFRIEIKQFISIYFLGNDPENLSGRQGCKERGHKRSPTGTLTLNRDKVTCRHENRKKKSGEKVKSQFLTWSWHARYTHRHILRHIHNAQECYDIEYVALRPSFFEMKWLSSFIEKIVSLCVHLDGKI